MSRRLATALTIAALAGPAAAGEVLTVVADEYCPYNCPPGGPQPGYALELLQQVFARRGIEVRYQEMSWDVAVEAVRAGRAAALVAARKGDAPDLLLPAQEIGRAAIGFAVRKGDPWRYRGPASFGGKRLGIVEGYDHGPELQPVIEASPHRVRQASGDAAVGKLVHELLQGRVDVIVEEHAALVYLAKASAGFEGVVLAGATEAADPLYVAFAPDAPRSREYARLLDEGITALRASGELARILARYGLEDWR